MNDEVYILIIVIIILIIIILVIIIITNNQRTTDNMGIISTETEKFPFQTFIINLDRKPERYDYVSRQLDELGIIKYQRWSATDGFNIDLLKMKKDGIKDELINKGLGLAGCASSHIRIWNYIANNNMDWTLILEDDVHFHPDFLTLFYQYWVNVPVDAKIIFPGYFDLPRDNQNIVLGQSVMCLHGYMLNSRGARYLLDNLLPMDEPIDGVITKHFKRNYGSFIFNSRVQVGGILPDHYREKNGDKCMFNGIIYQNREEYGRTIYQKDTTFNNHE